MPVVPAAAGKDDVIAAPENMWASGCGQALPGARSWVESSYYHIGTLGPWEELPLPKYPVPCKCLNGDSEVWPLRLRDVGPYR